MKAEPETAAGARNMALALIDYGKQQCQVATIAREVQMASALRHVLVGGWKRLGRVQTHDSA